MVIFFTAVRIFPFETARAKTQYFTREMDSKLCRKLNIETWQANNTIWYVPSRSDDSKKAQQVEISNLRTGLEYSRAIRREVAQENATLKARINELERALIKAKRENQELEHEPIKAEQEKQEPAERGGLCVACDDNVANIVLMPCNHLCLCEECHKKWNETCPTCRTEVKNIMKVFI